MMPISTLLVAFAAIFALYTDIRWGKIPNALILPFFIAGLVSQCFLGVYPLLSSIGATFIALIVGLVVFSCRMMGGGDVKFFIAAVATLGAAGGVQFVVYSLLCGGIFAALYALARGRFGSLVANLRTSALTLTPPATSIKMPYAIALLGGALCLLASETLFPALRIPV